MALRGISGGAAAVSPWVGRCTLSPTNFVGPVTLTMGGFTSNTIVAGTSGITVDATGKITLPRAGTYLVQITGRADLMSLTSPMRAQIIPQNQVNCALSGESTDGNVGMWTYNDSGVLPSPYAGTGILSATAAGANLQLAFNISTTLSTQTSLRIGFIVAVTYLGA